jgi:hypothetical protein
VTTPPLTLADRTRRWTEPLFLCLLIVLTLIAGLLTADRWAGMDAAFFSTISQLIVALFIAIAVDFLIKLRRSWKSWLERAAIVIMLVLSWTGLFACIAALVSLNPAAPTPVSPWLSGLAGTGLVAASAVVSLSFTERLRGKNKPRQTLIAVLFVAPPVILLALL